MLKTDVSYTSSGGISGFLIFNADGADHSKGPSLDTEAQIKRMVLCYRETQLHGLKT